MSVFEPSGKPENRFIYGSQAAPAQVVGVGFAVMDYLGMVKKMPNFDDAEAVKVEQWAITGGGPVSTALVTLVRMGIPVSYLGLLGDDMVGRAVREDFIREGVGVSRLRTQTKVRTPSTLVLVEAGTGRRAFISFRDAPLVMPLELEDHALIAEARYLHLDGWYAGLGLPAARSAKEAGVRVCLDAYQVDDRTPEWVSAADILIATETFPLRYTGEPDLEAASDLLLNQGPEIVVTTLSERGCYLATKDERFYQPGFTVRVSDTTGAGDVFHGAFLYGLLQNWDLKRIARFANAAGALKCTRFAGRAGIPTLAQVEAFLESQEDGL